MNSAVLNPCVASNLLHFDSLGRRAVVCLVHTDDGPHEVVQGRCAGHDRAVMPVAKVRITDAEDGATSECTLDSFLTANVSDEETCDQARALKVGEEFSVGGGAGPLMTIRRVA